ncbi:hypothetical protein [Mangrovimonas spongiae]|uniref:Uncharacterized protein n=1 Tax=Mangrovimonas spongiae TaxID=2494697 RepID=A0A3R9MG88_9FLAO|nr:hypothetical protein [Mangrovimonas spongiae]RSK41390.1 hypothetical protein EJA19_00515 [Mangrovimonas spongiae]
MRLLLLSVLCLVTTQNLDLSKIRETYKEAANDSTKVEAFYNSLQSVSKKDHVALVAYKGASIALKARHAKTIKEKKSGFVEGVSLIEYTIEKEPNAIEPRFIRLGIQENSPKILGYNKDLDADKTFLLKQFKHIRSSNLKNHIKDYILQSKVFTDEEKNVISTQ